MNRSSNGLPQFLLVLAVLVGIVTVLLAATGLWSVAEAVGIDTTFEGVSRLVFYAVAILAFEHPEGLPDEVPLVWTTARFGAVVFSVTTATGLLLELSQLLRELVMRFYDQLRSLFGAHPSVLLGLGWIGGPIASTLRNDSHIVYAIAVDDLGPGVAEARRVGVLVVAGDATDPRTRGRVPIHRAREVFVATGDDTVNVELAGDLLESSKHWNRKTPLPCYVHITNPTFAETLGWQQIWAYESDQLEFVPFSYQELAARDLFFGPKGIVGTPALRPDTHDAFHVVIVGFGVMGQSVARHVARFAHFASCGRPRMTVFDEDDRSFGSFLERYPAFSPPGLDLAAPRFRSAGSDAWTLSQGRPAASRHRIKPTEGEAAVEYAVHAEFQPLPGDFAAESFSKLLLHRFERLPPAGQVRMAIVVCLEEERASFEAALRIQYALAAAIADLDHWDESCRIPVYVHLPERGLATVLDKTDKTEWLTEQHKRRDELLPVRAFGIRDHVASHTRVTEQSPRKHATSAQGVYSLLAPLRAASEHLDYSSSNLDAVLHTHVKCAALGITLQKKQERPPKGATRVLGSLFDRKTDRVVRRLRRRYGKGVPRAVLAKQPDAVRQRLVLLGAVEHTNGGEADVHGIFDEVIAMIEDEMQAMGHDRDLPAQMEHNRWMGERLLKGWRYGQRNDTRRQRDSMKPWDQLGAGDKRYDRISLPRFIIEAHEEDVVAYWTGKS